MKQKLLHTGIRVLRILRDPYYQGNAAEMGFYFIFSIIPIMTLLLQGLSLFPLTEQLFASVMERFADEELAVSLLTTVREALSGAGGLPFLVVALWGASKIIFSMIRMANYTYKLEDRQRTGFLLSRARAVLTAAILILMIMGTLIVFVYGGALLKLFNSILSEFLGLTIYADWLFSVLRWPVALAIYWMILAALYKLLPGKKIPVRHTIPGSLFAAAGFIVITAGYSVYLKNFASFNVVYGSLGAVIALLLWFYFIGYIFMLGMVINAAWFENDL
ncbi:MAG: YihY/virulence factor BrkB family protein [Anaerovoracaceae bacterium]